jgi:hypothetical protein
MSSTDAIATLLEQRRQTWAARDVFGFAALYAEDFTVETQIAGTIKGRAAVAAKESELFAMFPDVSTENEETTIICGDIDFIPTERYTREDAVRAIDDANFVVELAGRVIRRAADPTDT